MKRINQLLFTGLVLLVFTACTPDGAEYIDELDIVYTNFDPNFEFESKGTFSIPDELIKIDQEDAPNEPGWKPEFGDPIYANAILETIKSNMRTYDYTEVDESVGFRLDAKNYQSFKTDGKAGQSNLGLNFGEVFSN